MNVPLQNLDGIPLVTPKQRRQANTKHVNDKTVEVRESLRALAIEKGAGSQLPTIRELRTLLNTSNATLMAALDQLASENILSRKERQGIFVSDSILQGVIHIIINVFGLTDIGRSPFWALLWGHLVRETEHRSTFQHEQYRFHFLHRASGLPLPDDFIEIVNSPQTKGCILIGVNARTYEHISLLHVPHVTFAGGGDITFQLDAQEKDRLAIDALVQQGCRKIGIWRAFWPPADPTLPLEDGAEEMQALTQMLGSQQVPFYPEFMRNVAIAKLDEARPSILQEHGYMLAQEVFGVQDRDKPDGVYITDDMLTSGALVALDELGIEVGQELKIATLVNTGSPILFGREKQMIAVEFDPADLAHAMFSQLEVAMAQGYQHEDRIVLIRPRLTL